MNTNCLAGMKCPKCGSEGPFWIATTAWVLWTDDGTEDIVDAEFEDESGTQCVNCKHYGLAKDFDEGE